MTCDYLNHKVNYGGEWVTIGALFWELGDRAAGLWLSDYRRGGGRIVRP